MANHVQTRAQTSVHTHPYNATHVHTRSRALTHVYTRGRTRPRTHTRTQTHMRHGSMEKLVGVSAATLEARETSGLLRTRHDSPAVRTRV